MKYKSRHYEVEAFRFEDGAVIPKWFQEAHELGRVFMTINPKEQFITIIASERNKLTADLGDWVCKIDDFIFPITNDEFEQRYERST